MQKVLLFLFTLSFFLTSNLIAQSKDFTYPKKVSDRSQAEFGPASEGRGTLFESFEGTTFPPAGWAKFNPDGGTGWSRLPAGTSPVPGFNGGTITVPPSGGTAVAFCSYASGGATSNDQWLVTPQITSVEASDSLYFWLRKFGTYLDRLEIKISTTTQSVAAMTIEVANINFVVADSGWLSYGYNIGSLVPAGSNIYIGFREIVANNQVDGASFSLDLVRVTGVQPGPGLATNPNPANNATNISLNPTLTWTNPSGLTGTEVFFGMNPASLTSVYSGAPSTSYSASGLIYNSNYYWRVNSTDAGGTSVGDIWSFKTMRDPNDSTVFVQDFENATFPPDGWLIETTGTTPRWTRQTTASGYGTGTAASRMDYYLSSAGQVHSMITEAFTGTSNGKLVFDHAYCSYTDNASDKLEIEYQLNGGVDWIVLVTYEGGNANPLATAPNQSGSFVPTASQWGTKTLNLPDGVTRIRFKATSAFGNNLWLDNIALFSIIPVELTSFSANVNLNNITLAWGTATETNNAGFEIQRKSDNEFHKVGYVAGFGTTTEAKIYSFIDSKLEPGNYSYRLKQVDFDGSFEYSNEVNVDVNAPLEFALAQNYPNPFNPATKINFSLKVDSKVSLKIFNVLGQEVATLLNGNIAAGSTTVDFNAHNLNSGVYVYKIEASGIDGSSFSSVKKMILTK